jgi:hypothetical protein
VVVFSVLQRDLSAGLHYHDLELAMNLDYENWLLWAKKVSSNPRFEYRRPVCGSYAIESMAQVNLSRRFACGNCHIWFETYEKVGRIFRLW